MLSETPCGLEQKGVKGAGAARGSTVRTHGNDWQGGQSSREVGEPPKWERFSGL